MTTFIAASKEFTGVVLQKSIWGTGTLTGFILYDRHTSLSLLLTDIVRVTEIAEETYRSGGKAAAGAIIGGLLTGGIGLLAGAAIGGRKRRTASFLIQFIDENHVAFEESDAQTVTTLSALAKKYMVQGLVSKD